MKKWLCWLGFWVWAPCAVWAQTVSVVPSATTYVATGGTVLRRALRDALQDRNSATASLPAVVTKATSAPDTVMPISGHTR